MTPTPNNKPCFEGWQQANLIRFAEEAFDKLQQQAAEIEHLRADLRDVRRAYRELILVQDDGK